jgi:hypothetical protein
MAKTSASFTLMDYTDGISLITGIDSNLPLTSLYDTSNQTLNPSWAGDTSLQLTPVVRKAGGSDVVSSMTAKTWKRRLAGEITWSAVTSGSNGETINATSGVLTVAQDKLTGDVWQIDYKFSGTYTDAVLGLDFPVEIVITLSRVANGTSFVVARAYATGGSQFKNSAPSSLQIQAELIRGTTQDTTNLSYQWKKSINGIIWEDISGGTSSNLSVTPSMVDSFAMFKCSITDTDATSDTYNSSFETEAVSILDVTDPYQAVIESTAGTYFKNGTGSTVLVCRVYQNGAEIDPTGTALNYTWTKTDKDGSPVAFTPTAVAHGSIVTTKKKAISVSHDDVTVKATYFCSVS